MAFTKLPSGAILVTGIASVHLARLAALLSGLRLEVAGIRVSRGRSIAAIVKQEFGFKGSKASVLAQLEQLVATAQANAGGQEVQ